MSETTFRPRLTLLDRDGCVRLHRASLEILRRTGVRVHSEEALALLGSAGCIVRLDLHT